MAQDKKATGQSGGLESFTYAGRKAHAPQLLGPPAAASEADAVGPVSTVDQPLCCTY